MHHVLWSFKTQSADRHGGLEGKNKEKRIYFTELKAKLRRQQTLGEHRGTETRQAVGRSTIHRQCGNAEPLNLKGH